MTLLLKLNLNIVKVYLHTNNKSIQKVTKTHRKNNFDLDLGPMTLLVKLIQDIVKVYLHTQNEHSRARHSKVIACTNRQTDAHTDMTENITFPLCGE